MKCKSHKQDNLFLLIKSLTKSEKRQFKLYVGRMGSNNNAKFLSLFNFLTQEKQEKDLCKRKSDMIDLETTLEDTREKRSVLERKNVELNCQLEALQEKFIQTNSEMGKLQEEVASIKATNDANKTQKETAESVTYLIRLKIWIVRAFCM